MIKTSARSIGSVWGSSHSRSSDCFGLAVIVSAGKSERILHLVNKCSLSEEKKKLNISYGASIPNCLFSSSETKCKKQEKQTKDKRQKKCISVLFLRPDIDIFCDVQISLILRLCQTINSSVNNIIERNRPVTDQKI